MASEIPSAISLFKSEARRAYTQWRTSGTVTHPPTMVNQNAAIDSKHRRVFSTNSTNGISRKPSIPLRARSKTNEGMPELRANNSKTEIPEIPINVRPIQRVVPSSTPPPSPLSVMTLPAFVQEERELEYKYRHTFIGTASLDDFLNVLESSPSHKTSRPKAAKAFVSLASTEQLQARQSSTVATGWELVSRITPDVVDGYNDYIAQAHVKLGSVTLRQFLELIPFYENEETHTIRVVEAFCAASHLDANIGAGPGSKARAFRSWMVRQGFR